jgi:hypothetical protein
LVNLNAVATDLALGFVANPSPPSGQTWTLPLLFGNLLTEAETRYGPRDPSWTPLGVDFSDGAPCIWYPGSNKNVVISLDRSASKDIYKAYFQLAHEVIHILSPTGISNALVVEEGLATIFCDEMSAKAGSGYRTTDQSYLNAAKDTQILLSIDVNIIKKLRNKCMRFVDFTPALIMVEAPNIAPQVAARLCKPF